MLLFFHRLNYKKRRLKDFLNRRRLIEYLQFRGLSQDNDINFPHSNVRKVCLLKLAQHMYLRLAGHACQNRQVLISLDGWRHSECSCYHHSYLVRFQSTQTS